ncbi:MAG: hypothetical protein AB8F34_14715 [Akkermansiaceae bacterium]
MNETLPPELTELEQILSNLIPSALPEETVDTLSVSVESSLCPDANLPEDDGLDDLEKHLEHINPATMRTDVVSRMIAAMDSWHEHVPVEEKVVSFSDQQVKPTVSGVPKPKTQSGNMIAAAAAVALLGAAAALILPHFSSDEKQALASGGDDFPQRTLTNVGDFNVSNQSTAKDAWLVPDALSHRVVNTADRGIVMSENQTLHRCIRLDSVERIKIEDEDGREIVISRPSVQYVLIPVETN